MSKDNRSLGSQGMPYSSEGALRIDIVYNDSVTVASLVARSGTLIARGVAKRNPRDARNTELGINLALARLLNKAAEVYARQAVKLSNPDPDPMREPLRAMKRANRAEQAKRKNARRREARNKYFEENKETWRIVDAANRPRQYDDADDWRARVFGDWGDR